MFCFIADDSVYTLKVSACPKQRPFVCRSDDGMCHSMEC